MIANNMYFVNKQLMWNLLCCDLQAGNLEFKKVQLFGMRNGISLKMKVQCFFLSFSY